MPEPDRRTLLKGGLLSIAGIAGWPSLSAAVQTASTPYNRPKLKITEIRTAEVRVHGYQVHVRIYTDQGLVGQGETTDAAMGNVPLIRSFCAPARRPGSAQRRGRLRADSHVGRLRGGAGRPVRHGADRRSKSRSGIWPARRWACRCTSCSAARCATACASTAIPAAREIPGDEQSKARIRQIQELGFTAVKIDIDDADDPARLDASTGPRPTARSTTWSRRSRSCASSIPKHFDLAVDMHAPLRRRHRESAWPRRSSRSSCMFLEEPVPAENIDAMRDVRESTSTPICCGENLYLRWGFREMLEKRAADIIMPDLQKCGGLLEGRKIADMAHTYYVPFAPHCRRLADWHDGHRARLRGDPELPRPGVALDRFARPLAQLGEGRGDHAEGLHHAARPARDRRRDERGWGAESASARNTVVRACHAKLTRDPMRFDVCRALARVALAAALLALGVRRRLRATGNSHARAADQIHARLDRRTLCRRTAQGGRRDPRAHEERDARRGLGRAARSRIQPSVRGRVVRDSSGEGAGRPCADGAVAARPSRHPQGD